MDRDQDIVIRLSWQGEDVTAVVLDDRGVPVHETAPPARVSNGMFVPWADPVGPGVTRMLTKALLPPPVRRHLAHRMEQMGGRYARVRLLTPDDGSRDLAGLRWEAVTVPSAKASDAEWRAWAAEPSAPLADGGCPLGVHPSFTLVRDVDTTAPVPTTTPVTVGRVTIADATAVHGEVAVPGFEEPLTVPEPPPEALVNADGLLVRHAVRGSRLSARVVDAPATPGALRQALSEGTQVFYFGGHHVASGLVVGTDAGDGPAWLDVDTLAGWLLQADVRLAVLMACDSAVSKNGEEPDQSAARRLVRAGVPHVVAVMGKMSHGQAEKFAGSFFSALTRGEEIDRALLAGRARLDGAAAVPVLFTRHGVRDLAVELLPELRETRRAPVAHRLPVGDGVLVSEPDERHRVHLDARWCLTEPPVLDVLSDPTADDLPRLMLDAERLLVRARNAAGHVHEALRRWYVYEVGADRLPRTESELRARVSPAYEQPAPGADRGVGLVLRLDGTAVPHDGFRQELDQLYRFGWDLQVVVLQIGDEDPVRVRDSAEELARALGLDEYLLRTPVSSAAPSGTAPRPRRLLMANTDTGASGRGAGELLAWVRDADESGRPGPFFGVDPRTVVEELNAEASWGGPQGERGALDVVRHYWPALYRPLLEAYASARSRPARGLSLQLAARRDEDLDRWLRAAGEHLPFPDEVGPLDRGRELVGTVVLGLLRAGHADTDAFEEWRAEAPPEVVEAVAAAERVPAALLGRDLARPDVAVALDRAGLLDSVDLGRLDPTGRWHGTWALLARRPLTEATARWLYGLGEAPRRVLGLAPATGPGSEGFDRELEVQLTAYRQALVPPLPRTQVGG
ncbi:CHAT domain-containing protein [Streptomyces aureus]|uniref:CHAT domain-containing protein n=1 Tax=Streptomyces aureus TaxID=193461 RepID=UPI0006E3CF41|nr:CHAT domain-containing protein [Streptomyces aureus]